MLRVSRLNIFRAVLYVCVYSKYTYLSVDRSHINGPTVCGQLEAFIVIMDWAEVSESETTCSRL